MLTLGNYFELQGRLPPLESRFWIPYALNRQEAPHSREGTLRAHSYAGFISLRQLQ